MTTLLLPPISGPGARYDQVSALPHGHFAIEPRCAMVAFAGRTSRFLPAVSARFREVEGSIQIDATTGVIEIDVAILLASVTSGNRAWDEMIAVADPFDARAHPVARYTGRADGFGRAVADQPPAINIQGELGMRGLCCSVPLTADWQQTAAGHLTVQAAGIVDRAGFGLRFDIPGLSRLLPQRMNLTIDIRAGRSPAAHI